MELSDCFFEIMRNFKYRVFVDHIGDLCGEKTVSNIEAKRCEKKTHTPNEGVD